jgi:hypothetical protein
MHEAQPFSLSLPLHEAPANAAKDCETLPRLLMLGLGEPANGARDGETLPRLLMLGRGEPRLMMLGRFDCEAEADE